MARMVNCVKLGRELPGLNEPPFPGALGQRIYDQVSREAWNLWQSQSTLILNHYGLTMGDPQAQKLMMQQMEEFFFGEGARMPDGWVPPGQSSKGGPAPRAKK